MSVLKIGLITTVCAAVGGIAGSAFGMDGLEEVATDLQDNLQSAREVMSELVESVPQDTQEITQIARRVRDVDYDFFAESSGMVKKAMAGKLDADEIAQGLPEIPDAVIEAADLTQQDVEAYDVLSENLRDINQAARPVGQDAGVLYNELKKPVTVGAMVGGGAGLALSMTDNSPKWKEKIAHGDMALKEGSPER